MILAMVVTLGVFFFPWIPMLCLRKSKELFPWALLFHLGFLCFLSAITYWIWPYSMAKLILLPCLSGILISVAIPNRALPARMMSGKRICVLLFLALFINADLFVIFGHQGFGMPGGKIWHPEETYIRAPFSNDPIRNVMLTGSLIRNDGSPFLAQSKLSYQMFWFHLQTLILSPLRTWWSYDSLFQPALGILFALSCLFSFVLMSAAIQLRPSLLKKKGLFLFVLFLSFTHADIYSYLHALWQYGKAGIEADWSFPPIFFRNYSLKLMELASPQHLLFLSFQLLYGFGAWRIRDPKIRETWMGIAIALGFLVSPPMAVLFYPVLFVVEMISRCHTARETLTRWGLAGVMSILSHQFCLGNPFSLFFRKAVSRVEFLHGGWWNFTFPISLLGAVGVMGFVVLWVAVRDLGTNGTRFRRQHIFVIIAASLFLQYIVTSLEIRRHVAMWLSFLGAVYLLRYFQWRKFPRVGTIGFSFIALLLHFYFLYCYLGKPSSLDPKIPWRDYFAVNRVIEKEFPKMPVVAATEPVIHGLSHHPVNEVAVSYAFGGHVYIHTDMTDEQVELVRRIESPEDVLPYALRLGYPAVVWGPAEEEIWGERFRDRFIQENNLLARRGTVGLYRLEDRLLADFKSGQFKLPSWSTEAEYYREIAKVLYAKGWLREAVDNFQESLIREPNRIETLLPLAHTLITYRKYPDAIEVLERAQSLRPQDVEISELKALCYSKQGKWELARLALLKK